jgi:tRNA(Arg) A34 adenosine deaminase TadA
MCLGAIWWARIDTIYYANTRDDAARIGFDDAALYREVSLDLHERQLPLVRHHSDEATALMREWLAKEDKIPY